MILLASSQIAVRMLFDFGVIWIDPLLRALVLWTGLIGAAIGSRNNKHISIDLLPLLHAERFQLVAKGIAGLFTASVCTVIAWNGGRWVITDFQDGFSGFAGLPAWALEIIIPLSFGLIALRYLLHSLNWADIFMRSAEKTNMQS